MPNKIVQLNFTPYIYNGFAIRGCFKLGVSCLAMHDSSLKGFLLMQRIGRILNREVFLVFF